MSMRSIWKGFIRFSLVTIPICIYNATATEEKISFHQLHRGCNGAVGYDRKCKKCGKTLGAADIVKGYEYEPGLYVTVEPSDLEHLKLKSTKMIEIEKFVDAAEVHPMLYETPFFAGPDGEVALKPYSLLREALKESGKMGIGKVVLREREEIVMVSPHDEGLLLYRLRYPHELRSIRDVPGLGKPVPADQAQLKLARSLVAAMSAPFAEMELRDTYHEVLKEMIAAKIAGKEVVAVTEEERPVIDIMTALKESIAKAAARGKPPAKAAHKAKSSKPELVRG
jgi:DNA end-binding protein Ku